MTCPDSFGSGVLAGMLLAAGAQALQWLITPAAHLNASTAQAVGVSVQAALSFGTPGWLVWRARRRRAGTGALSGPDDR